MNEHPSIATVALGSNLGDREALLRRAVGLLAATDGVELLESSRVFETEPVGPGRQGPYLNAVLRLRSELSPRSLLERMLEIETGCGRIRAGESRNGPRYLDLDLLLFEDRCIDEKGLVVPHPRLHERSFVLEPLCDLAPTERHPRLGITFEELGRRARASKAVSVWNCAPLVARGLQDGAPEAAAIWNQGGPRMAIVAVSISPVGAGVSVSSHVAEALRVVRAQDKVKYRLDSMFTTLEGDIDEIFALVRRMQEAVFSAGAERVGTVLKIDDRRDRETSMEGKVDAVEALLGST